MAFADWQDSIVGQKFDGDNDGSFDCVDVPESWVLYLWPNNPESLELGYGNAKDIYNNSNSSFFEKIDYSPGLVPLQGDIIVFGATPSNPYGHIAVVISANDTSVQVIQENSYTQQAAYIGTLGYSYCLGFLRPLINIEGVKMYDKVTLNIARAMAFFYGGDLSALNGDRDAELQADHVGKDLTEAYMNSWYVSPEVQVNQTRLLSPPAPTPQASLPNPAGLLTASDPTPANQEKVNIFVALWKALFG